MLDEDLGFALNLSFSCLLRMKTSQFQELLHRQLEATFRGIHNLLDILVLLVSLFLFWAIYVTKLIEG